MKANSRYFKNDTFLSSRFIEALNGFRSKYGYWPTSIEAYDGTLAALATEVLSPLGFFMLQNKVELILIHEQKIIAYGRGPDKFDYGDEGWSSNGVHAHSALQWLGFAD